MYALRLKTTFYMASLYGSVHTQQLSIPRKHSRILGAFASVILKNLGINVLYRYTELFIMKGYILCASKKSVFS